MARGIKNGGGSFPIYLKDDAEEEGGSSSRSAKRSSPGTSRQRSRLLSKENTSQRSPISGSSFNASDTGQLSYMSEDGKTPTARRDSTLSLFGRGGRSARTVTDENPEDKDQVRYKPRVPIDFNYQKISSWVIATRSDWNLRQLEQTNVEELAEAVGKLTHVRLDGQGIIKIENLEPVAKTVTHLGLHSNQISKIENLDSLVHLRFLNLAHNNISVLENIGHLKNLQCLDVSHNKIDFLPPEEFASSISILSSNGNPLRDMDAWAWRSLLRALPMLRHHNGKDVSELLREHFPPEDASPLLPGEGTVQPDADLLTSSMRVAPVPAEFLPAYGGVGLLNAHSAVLEHQRKNFQASRWTQELQTARVQERRRQQTDLSSLRASVSSSIQSVTSSLSSLSATLSSSRRAITLAPPTEPLAGLPPATSPSSSRPSSPRHQRAVPLLD